MHLITYAAPVTKAMLKNFHGLKYYSLPALPAGYKVPNWFSIELGIFAGQLYVTHEECSHIAQYLQGPQADGEDAAATVRGTFARKPMGFLCEWLPLRRQVSEVMQTPMGYIIQGRMHALHPDHPFFVTRVKGAPDMMDTPVLSNGSSDDTSDDDENDFSDMGGEAEEGWGDLEEEDMGDKVPGKEASEVL